MPHLLPLAPDVIKAVAVHPVRIISRRAIERLGHDTSRITGWVRGSVLERLLPGWYRIVGDAVPPWQHVVVAWAYLTEGHPHARVRLTGQAALVAVGLELRIPRHPTFLVENGRRVRLPGQYFATIQRVGLPSSGGASFLGMVLEEPEHALADMLREQTIADDALRLLLYQLINRLRVTPQQMATAWSARPRQQVARLRSLIADGTLQHESPAERSTFLDVFAAHPPPPDCQVWITPHRRVDFVYLFAALILEYHGEDAHQNQVDEDASRTYEFSQLGFDLMVVTKSMTRDAGALAAHVHDRRRCREELFLAGRLPRPPLPVQHERLYPLRTLHPGL